MMVPGKQNYSLTWAWSMSYDPVRAVNDALTSIPEDSGKSSGMCVCAAALPATLD